MLFQCSSIFAPKQMNRIWAEIRPDLQTALAISDGSRATALQIALTTSPQVSIGLRLARRQMLSGLRVVGMQSSLLLPQPLDGDVDIFRRHRIAVLI